MAALLALPMTALAADYPPPVVNDRYEVENSIQPLSQAGCDMKIESFVFDQHGYLWTVENDWLDGLGTSRLVKRTANGEPIGIFGQGLGQEYLWFGTAVAVHPSTGHLYVGDINNHRVAIYDPVSGSFLGQLGGPSSELTSITDQPYGFDMPTDIVFDSFGNIFVSDMGNHRILKYDSGHQFITAWGSFGGDLVDPGQTPQGPGLLEPAGMSIDDSGNIWVADMGNNRVQKYDLSGNHLETLRPDAPTGGDYFYMPLDVTVDEHGTVYVTDQPFDYPYQGGRFSRWGSQQDPLGEYGEATETHGALYRPTSVGVDQWGTVWITHWGDGIYGGIESWALNPGSPDLEPPTTTSNIPAGWTRGPFSVSLTSVDTSSPVLATYYSTNGSEPTTSYADPFVVDSEGENTIKYYSVDRPGNRESTKTQVLKLDNQAPSSLASVVPTYYGQARITFAASDSLSGVTNIWWKIGNGTPSNSPEAIVSAQGSYTLTYWAEDAAGNAETSNVAYFTVAPEDDYPPVTYWAESSPDWFRSNPRVTLVAEDDVSGVSATYYRINGSDDTTYTGSFIWSSEGVHTLEYWSVDQLGQTEPVHTESIKLDKTKPASAATVPLEPIGSATISFEASDTVSGVRFLEWRLDTDTEWTQGSSAYIPTYGNYTVWHRAIDWAGNVENQKSVNLQILQPDDNPPVTTANIPQTGWVKGPYNVQFSAQDDISGVAETHYSVDGAPFAMYEPDTIFVEDGIHSVAWYSIDNRGNQETTKTATLKVDSVAPNTTDDHQAAYTGPATINLFPEDGLSETQTWYRIDSEPQVMGTQISLTVYRTYVITYWSVDDAGNIEDANVINVTLSPPDIVPPVTTFSGPAGWQKGSAQFSLSAVDASSTVKSTWYSTDGTNYIPYYSPVTIVTQGTSTIWYYSIDFFNNAETPKTSQLRVDATPPVTTSNATSSYTEEAVITLAPTDTYSGIGATYYRVNGGDWQSGTQAIVPWSRNRKTHTLEWYSTDNVGNNESIKSATFDVRLTSNTEHEDEPLIVYRGGWDLASNQNLALSSDNGAFALVAFQGTKLDLFSQMGNSYGKMRVSLAGTGESSVIDLYSPNNSNHNLVWSTGDLMYGDYLVKIEYLGEKNAQSSGTTIDFDYMNVEGTLMEVPDSEPPVTTDDAPSSWAAGPVAVTLSAQDTTTGVEAIYATTNGVDPTTANVYTAPLSFATEGQHTLKYFAVDRRGNAETIKSKTVRVDNTAPVTNTTVQTTYTGAASAALLPSDSYSGVAYTRWRIDGGAWTTGTAVNIPGTPGYYRLEWYSVDNVGHVETTKIRDITVYSRFQENDSRVSYRGTWTTATNANHSGGAAKVTSVYDSAVYVSFTGTQIDWVSALDPAYGYALVSIDGGPETSVVVNGSTSYRQRVWSSGVLPTGPHTLKIVHPGSSVSFPDNSFAVDAFDVVGTLVADTVAPVTSDDAVTGWQTSPVTLSLTSADSGTWVQSTQYRINTGSWTPYSGPIAFDEEGTFNVDYYSVDGAGNAEQLKSATLTLDWTAPETTDDAPTDWVQGPVTVQLDSSDAHSGVDTILYSTDGSEPSLEAADGTVAISDEGTTTIKYAAVDTAGNLEATKQCLVRIDDTAPSSADDAPEDWVAGPVSVSLASSDALSGVNEISYRINGGELATYIEPLSISAEGTTTLEYFATDNAGNSEAAQTATVRIDDTHPTTVDDAPAGWSTTPVTVALTAEDAVSGVAATFYSTDGSFPTLPYSDPVVIASQGMTTLKYYTVDIKGNVEPVSMTTVMVDSVAPVSSDDAPQDWVNGPVTVQLSSADEHSGVDHILYSTDGSAPSVIATGGVVAVSAEGTTTVRYAAVDNAGNVESAKQCIVRIDDTAPETLSDALQSYHGTAVITFTATDALSGAAGTSWRLDGGEWTTGTSVTVSDGGDHEVEWRSVDTVGNLEDVRTASFSVAERLEAETPAVYYKGTWTDVAETSASGGSFRSTASTDSAMRVTFTGTGIEWVTSNGTDLGIARLTLDGGEPQLVDLYGPAAFQQTVWNSGALESGVHTLLIEYAGLKNAESTGYAIGVDALDVTGTLVSDSVPPVTSIQAPSGWQKSDAPVVLNASDADSFVASTFYRLNGSDPVIYSGPFSVSAEGTTTVDYWSVDSEGNAETVSSAIVLVDKTGPATATDAPAEWVDGPVTVNFSATDALSGTSRILYSTDGSTPSTEPTGNAVTISDEGITTLLFCAEDVAGNREETQTATVRIDSIAPVTTDDAPEGWVSGPVALTLGADDAASGVASTEYRVNGGDWTPYAAPVSISDQGVTTVEYRSTDVKGNVEQTESTTVSIDDEAPTTASDAPSEWTTGIVDVTLTATDTVSGVASTEYRVNGGDWTPYAAPVSISDQGVTTVEYRSTDVKGNVEQTASTTVRIDNTAPVTTSDALESYLSTATIELVAEDPLSGVVKTEYRLDGGVWTDGTTITTSAGGTHTIEWRSSDAVGNVESVQSVTFELFKRYEQTDSRVLFRGTWPNANNSKHSSGNWRFAYSQGAAAHVVFDGTRIDVLGATGPIYGQAAYRIDGGEPVVVDYYSPAYQFQQLLHSFAGLDDREHTLSIEWLSSRNESSTANYIGVDAVDVLGSLSADVDPPVSSLTVPDGWQTVDVPIEVTTEDAHSWVSSTKYRLNGGDLQTYSGPFTLSAEGTTTITYFSTDGAANAEEARTATVLIDKTAPTTLDDAPVGWIGAATNVTLQATDVHSGVASTYYSLDGGPSQEYTGPIAVTQPGEHTLSYYSVDEAGNSEGEHTASVLIDGEAPVTTDDAPSGWVTHDVDVTLTAIDTVSAEVSTFYRVNGGDEIPYSSPILVSAEGTTTIEYWSIDTAGNAEQVRSIDVLVDKTTPATAHDISDVYYGSATIALEPTDGQSGIAQTLWSLNGSAPAAGSTIEVPDLGVYTLTFGSSDVAGNVESEQTVEFTVADRNEQDAEEVGYTTAWATSNNSFHSGGSYRFVNSAQSYAEIKFTGRRLTWIAPTNSSFGIASVTLDGGAPTDVDLYSPSVRYQQRVWDSGVLGEGEHTLRIEWTGRKNAESSNTNIGIDALDVAGPLVQVSMAQPMVSHEQVDARITYAGKWPVSTNSRMSGGSYAFNQGPDGFANVKFSGTRAVLVAPTNSSFGIATVSIDGAAPVDIDLYSPTIAYQQRVWDSGSLTEGEHTLRIAWTGRKNPSSSGTFVGLDAVLVAGDLLQADATEVVTEHEQTDRHVVYEGTWSTSTNSNMSGGSYRFSNKSGSTATIAFTGTRASWVTATNSSFGQALVSVDGGAPVLVDLYSPTVQYKQTVWSSGTLTDGRHTITITNAGSKNGASSGINVGIDRVDLVGSITPVRLDQSHTRMAYDGSWGTSTNSLMSGGSYSFVGSEGALNVTFQGTSIAWVTAKNNSFGIARVYIDGTLHSEVDLYSPTIQYQQTVWDSGVLADGRHTLRIEWTGTKNAASSGTFVGVDALDCAGYLTPRRFEQADSLASQLGNWSTSSNAQMSGGGYMFANSTGATANLTFRGTRFDWITIRNSQAGIAQVSIDGGAPVDVDLYSPTTAYQQSVWSSGEMSNGVHTVTISWTGRKNAASSGTNIGIDAVDVVGSLCLRTFEQVSPGITYSLGWQNSNNVNMSGGSYQFASSNDASATIVFTGKQLDWTTIKSPAMGIAEVSVDGGPPQLVDLYSATTKYKQTVWSTGTLTNGTHTIVIRRTGTKNPAATNYYVGIDTVALSGVLTP